MKIKEWFKTKTSFDYLIYVVLTICVIMIVVYFLNFNGKPSKELEDWSRFGNYFAAVFGLLAFLGALFTARQSDERAKKAEEEIIKREERDLFFKLQNFISEEKINSQIKEIINKINRSASYLISKELFKMILSGLNTRKIDQMIDIDVTNEDFVLITSFLNNIKEVNKFSSLYNSATEFTGDSVDFEYLQQNDNRLHSNPFGGLSFTDKDLNALFHFIHSVYPNPKLIFQILNTIKNELDGQFVLISSYYNIYKYLIISVNQFTNNEMYFQLIKAQLSDNEKVILLIYSVLLQENVEMVEILKNKKIIDSINENAFYLYDSKNYNISYMINGILDCYINK